ncbi:MAG: aspartate/glutamate racemase family protein [Promethearchaeota archaeon]
MKTIGLIGGMSWESSLEYYRIMNEIVKTRLGGLHSAKCIMYSVDFAPFEIWMKEGNWDEITKELSDVALKLEKSGADIILICTNTMHKLFEKIQGQINIPILHIADAAAAEIKKLGLKTVGLLGTKFTMEGAFYRERLSDKHNINVIIPTQEDRELVDNIIFEELILGKITDTSKEIYKRIISDLQAQKAEGVILGCTEIPLLISQEDSPIPVFDTTYLHAEYAISKALEQ